jgi:PTH1 family peptidyl-tRNA hydrolase
VWLLVGLGNPGPRYAGTRHNAGFRVLERFAARHGIALDARRFHGHFGEGSAQGERVALLEPHTFMNRAGGAVAAALAGLALDDPSRELILVYDDVDLPFGRLRVRASGSAGGHRGVDHVIATLGRNDFARLRFGVGRPEPAGDTAEWVLEPFSAEEEQALPELLERAADALDAILSQGTPAAMNRYNADPAP